VIAPVTTWRSDDLKHIEGTIVFARLQISIALLKLNSRKQLMKRTTGKILNSNSTKDDIPGAQPPPAAQPPEEPQALEVSSIPKAAGGAASAITAACFAFSEMGIIRGTRTLLRLNQKQGVACPGCAWPEPDGERSHFEFCEEGAKHVADEATRKRVTADFFAQWSVPDLSQQSDFWLNQQGRLTQPMILREGSHHYVPLNWNDAFRLIANELNSLQSPDEAIFIRQVAPATRRRFSTSSSCGNLGPTICRTVRICATSPAARG
jgi:hypothetical protein